MTSLTRQATGLISLLLVLTGLAVYTYTNAVQSDFTKTDFGPYLATANRMAAQDPIYVVNNERLYTAEQYVYPPTPALLFRGLAGMPVKEACHLWIRINIFLLVAIIAFYCFMERINPLKEMGLTLMLCITAFYSFPARVEIFIGNLDFFVLISLLGVLALCRYKRFKTAALALSMAASIKTWAILFALYFVFMRKWKEAALAVAGFAAINGVIFCFLGLDEFVSFVQTQKLYACQPKLNSNAILPMCHLFAGEPQFEHHRQQVLFPGAQTVLPIVGDIAVVFVFCTAMVLAWRLGKVLAPGQMSLLMSLCIMTILLLVPLCHQYYYIMALPVVWSLMIYSDSVKRVGRVIEDDVVGVVMWGGAFIAFLLLSMESPGLMEPNSVTGFGEHAPLGYGTTIVAGLLLWLTSAMAVYSCKNEKAPPTDPDALGSRQRELVAAG